MGANFPEKEPPVYINFWYPIARSEDIRTYEPHRTKVLGQHLVAFRDPDGNAHVLHDVCVHRGQHFIQPGTCLSLNPGLRAARLFFS